MVQTSSLEVGMNLTWFAREGSSDLAIFVNQMKGAWPLASSGTYGTYDENDYLTEDPDTGVGVMQILRRDPGLDGIDPLTGDFRLYGQGDGDIRLYQSEIGQLQGWTDTSTLATEVIGGETYWYVDFAFENLSESALNLVALYLDNIDPNDPIQDLALVHQTHLDNFRAGETFTPEFLSDVSGYDALRYMNWTGANLYEHDDDWNATDPDARYIDADNITYNTGSAGWDRSPVYVGTVPIEYITELSNLTDSDPWINLPVDMSDEMAQAWAEAVKAQLEDGLEVYWEYGNEVWNTAVGFEGYNYALALGEETFTGFTGDDATLVAEWMSYRSMQLFDVIADVFAEDADGVHYVAPGWAYEPTVLPDGSFATTGLMPTYFAATEAQKMEDAPSLPEDRITDYAVGLYYGFSFDEGLRDEAMIEYLLDAYDGDEAGAEALAKWMLFGFDEDVLIEVSTSAVSSPLTGVTYSADLDIGVAQLLRDDVSAGLDPFTELEQVLRLSGTDLQYRGVNAADWTTVLSFDTAPPETLAEMIEDVQIVGYGFQWWGTYYSGFSTGLRISEIIRMDGHTAYAESLGLDVLAYEGGIHMPDPIAGAEGLYEAYLTGAGVDVQRAWMEAAEANGFDLYMHFTSHRSHADDVDSLGVRAYVGQPEAEVPMDALLKELALANEGPDLPTTPQQIVGTQDDDLLTGGLANDTINGRGGNDTQLGYDGDDYLRGGSGVDQLDGGAGDDYLRGEAGDDLLVGGAGNDSLSGDAGADQISGGDDDDVILGGNGNDLLLGDNGADEIYGHADNDTLEGGSGNDKLMGDAGDDLLLGEVGADTLSGGAGNDTLAGGAGDDLLTGGSGADVFIFSEEAAGDYDTVSKFESGIDVLQIITSDPVELTISGSGSLVRFGTALDNHIFMSAQIISEADIEVISDAIL